MSNERRQIEADIREDVSRFEDGEDPRETLARVNARIYSCQAKGIDVPGALLRLNKALITECVSRSQGR
jgi:hypothetical protein